MSDKTELAKRLRSFCNRAVSMHPGMQNQVFTIPAKRSRDKVLEMYEHCLKALNKDERDAFAAILTKLESGM